MRNKDRNRKRQGYKETTVRRQEQGGEGALTTVQPKPSNVSHPFLFVLLSVYIIYTFFFTRSPSMPGEQFNCSLSCLLSLFFCPAQAERRPFIPFFFPIHIASASLSLSTACADACCEPVCLPVASSPAFVIS